METLIGKLKAKLQLLELTHEKTEGIISTGITEKIRRHEEALQSIVIGAEEIKREVEQAKLEGGEALDKVKEWGKEFELKIDAADTKITLLEERVNRMVADAENEERETKEGVFSAITPQTSLVIVQLSQAPPIGRNFYKRRGFVLIALALIEQLAVEAEETALAVSRGITHLSAISLPDLQTKELL